MHQESILGITAVIGGFPMSVVPYHPRDRR